MNHSLPLKFFEKMKKDLRNWETNVVPEYENDYRKRINY